MPGGRSWLARLEQAQALQGSHGATAHNQATASSDVDVWVGLDPPAPYATVHLKQALEELLQRPVDLVRLHERMNPALRRAILREGISG